MMSKVILFIFTLLSILALFLTYDGRSLQGVSSENTHKQIRSSHSGSWFGSSGGGFSSGK